MEQKGILTEGEHIVWESKARQFKVQEAPFATRNLILWIILAAVVVIYAIAYVPGAVASGRSLVEILIIGCVVALIPAILTYNSIHDCSVICNQLEYVITNKRALVVNKDQHISMELTADTPYRIETRPDGNQVLFLGSTVKSKLISARTLAVIGSKNEQNQYEGLVFYSIPNANEACKAAGLA